MIKFIKGVFIALFSFSVSLACVARVTDYAKCIVLYSELCLARPTPIDLNPNKLIIIHL